MSLADRTIGAALLGIAAVVFAYYTTWTLILPFVDGAHRIRRLFPSPHYAVAIPLALLGTALLGATMFISYVMIRGGGAKRQKAAIQSPPLACLAPLGEAQAATAGTRKHA